MHESQKVASSFQTKDGLDSIIIVFGFLHGSKATMYL